MYKDKPAISASKYIVCIRGCKLKCPWVGREGAKWRICSAPDNDYHVRSGSDH